jgi:hypothetical protein
MAAPIDVLDAEEEALKFDLEAEKAVFLLSK